MKQICLQADAVCEGERIDKYLAEVMKDYSRSFLQKQFREGNITVNESGSRQSGAGYFGRGDSSGHSL